VNSGPACDEGRGPRPALLLNEDDRWPDSWRQLEMPPPGWRAPTSGERRTDPGAETRAPSPFLTPPGLRLPSLGAL